MKTLRHLLRLSILAAALFTLSAEAQAPADVRIALVIGNSAYIGGAALANPANDAKAMATVLRGMGFDVLELRDGNKAQMNAAVVKVQAALKGKQGVGMLYYAGHGLQVDARNYMVPVDAKILKVADVPQQTVDVNSVVEAFKTAGNRMNILVLDACRNNPFGSINTGKGLAPLDAPSGTFLAYATAPGNVAEDGDVKTGNGLYTQYLLQELKKPNARIEDVFKRVRFAVRKASDGRQIPWESTSLEDDFQFNDGKIIALTKPMAQQLQAEFNVEKQGWDRIKDSRNADDFYAFLQKYPRGTISEAAQARINLLSKPTLVVQGAGADRKDDAYTRAVFRLGDEYELMSYSTSLPKGFKLVQRVTKVTADEIQVTTNGEGVEIFDHAGRSHGAKGEGYSLSYDPPQDFFPAGLIQVGQRWKLAYNSISSQGTQTITGESRVLARERVTVGAGTFDTFKIESITYSTIATNPTRCHFWITSDVPSFIKMNCNYPGGDNQTVELSRMKRGT